MVMISMVFVYKGYLEIFLWPVIFPLEAGFGTANWLFGFILAAFLALVGLLALYLASPRLNLSRAAQESYFRWASQQVSLLGDSSLYRQMKLRDRLGVQHPPSRIPGRAGAWSLLWKDFVISQRGLNFGFVGVWVGIFGISMSLAVAPDWGTRFWAFIIWCWLVGQRGTERCTGGDKAGIIITIVRYKQLRHFLFAKKHPPHQLSFDFFGLLYCCFKNKMGVW